MTGFIDSILTSHGEMSWLAFGLTVFVKGSLILCLAAVVNLALRGASASIRHLVWTVAFVAVVVLPVASLSLPGWQVPVVARIVQPAAETLVPVLDEAPQRRVTQALREERAAFPAPRAGAVPSSLSPVSVDASMSWPDVAVIVWLGGLFLVALRLVVGLAAVRLEVRRAKEVTDEGWIGLLRDLVRRIGLGKDVRLLQTHRSMVPAASGFVYPKVLLPAGADEWSVDCRRGVLLHELGHVKRGDCWTQILIQLACAAYWWNPLAWYAARKLRQESERACDDLVLDSGTRASDYAHDLLDMARYLTTSRRPLLAGPALAHRSRLEERLLAILDPRLARHRLGPVSVMAAVFVSVGIEADGGTGASTVSGTVSQLISRSAVGLAAG